LNRLRERIANNKELIDTKESISKHNDFEKEIFKEKEELKQDIENEKFDLEILTQCLNNKKFNFLNENKTLEEAIEAEDETIKRAQEQFGKLKAEKENLYSLIELEIENTRINMDKELIDAKTRIQNEKANLIKQESKMKKILDENLYENKNEKEIIEKEIENLFTERNQIDQEIEKFKIKEISIREAIMNEFNGLNELKKQDLEELNEEEERVKTLYDNSLKNMEKLVEFKKQEILVSELKFGELDLKLDENNKILNGFLSKVSFKKLKNDIEINK
jgi:hypothetical protein